MDAAGLRVRCDVNEFWRLKLQNDAICHYKLHSFDHGTFNRPNDLDFTTTDLMGCCVEVACPLSEFCRLRLRRDLIEFFGLILWKLFMEFCGLSVLWLFSVA